MQQNKLNHLKNNINVNNTVLPLKNGDWNIPNNLSSSDIVSSNEINIKNALKLMRGKISIYRNSNNDDVIKRESRILIEYLKEWGELLNCSFSKNFEHSAYTLLKWHNIPIESWKLIILLDWKEVEIKTIGSEQENFDIWPLTVSQNWEIMFDTSTVGWGRALQVGNQQYWVFPGWIYNKWFLDDDTPYYEAETTSSTKGLFIGKKNILNGIVWLGSVSNIVRFKINEDGKNYWAQCEDSLWKHIFIKDGKILKTLKKSEIDNQGFSNTFMSTNIKNNCVDLIATYYGREDNKRRKKHNKYVISDINWQIKEFWPVDDIFFYKNSFWWINYSYIDSGIVYNKEGVCILWWEDNKVTVEAQIPLNQWSNSMFIYSFDSDDINSSSPKVRKARIIISNWKYLDYDCTDFKFGQWFDKMKDNKFSLNLRWKILDFTIKWTNYSKVYVWSKSFDSKILGIFDILWSITEKEES
jgi:hypothetical protein